MPRAKTYQGDSAATASKSLKIPIGGVEFREQLTYFTKKMGSRLNVQRLEPLLVSGYEQNGPGRLSHPVAFGAN